MPHLVGVGVEIDLHGIGRSVNSNRTSAMNHTLRPTWNAAISPRFPTSGRAARRGTLTKGAALLMGSTGLCCHLIAGPTGGQVTTGSGQITQSGTTTTIAQNSPTLGLNWLSFNVAANETVNFVQPGQNSIAVNQILSSSGSEILGHLNANGQVWLINPNGILFGSNAQVNVGGLVASTLAPTGSDGAGGTAFIGGGTGSIVNQGSITAAKGGYVALLGNSVSNQGVVSAQLGTVALGAGSATTLTFSGNKLLKLEVDRSKLDALAENKGLIEADGGAVYMTAGAANSLLASAVNTTGVIRAKSVDNHNGTIVLGAGLPAGEVTVEGLIDVSSDRGVGGDVTATAGSVTVGPNATVNASGSSGGGSIRIGGGWQGGEGVAQATTVKVADSATLDASATTLGSGGEIVVRSDVSDMNSTAEVAGTLLAQGGVNGGNGGRIETSGHWLNVDGITANASAPKGTGGEWLLDPYNVTIGSSTSGNTYSPPNFSPSSSDSTILASTIGTALAGGSSVTITTGSSGSSLGDITVNSPITKASGNTDVTLTLQAADSIVVNQAISNTGGTGKLNVSLLADNDNGTHDGVGVILLNNNISTGGGYIQFGNGATATINGVNTLVGGDVYVGGSSAINLTTSGGNVTFNGQTLIANTNGLNINTTGSTNGNVSFGSSIDSGDSYSFVSSSGISWTSALSAAASGTGTNPGDTFLSTPSTRLQNSVASAAAGYQSSWLGGARGGNGNLGGSATWYWVSGPLGLANSGTGTAFFTQNGSSTTTGSGGTAINGAFTNWNAGEPNNAGGTNMTSSGKGEWVMQFTGSQGQWNDLSPTNTNGIQGYVKETNLAASPLTINTGTGTVTIAGDVGAAKALASLAVNAGSIAVSGTALITNGAQTYNNALTINSSGAFHLSDSSLSITNSNQALSLTATGNVTLDGPSSVAGPISIYGGNITIDSGATLASTAANQGILLKATGGITDGANLTTNGGDITLWANSAGASTGGIQVSNGVTLSSSGGAITLGGSANNATISGLTARSANGTTLPQGYAENLSGTFAGVMLGTYAGTTGENANVTINSGNGNISMAGQSNQYVNGLSIGMYSYEGINVNAGNGNITLNGLSTGATAGQTDIGMTLAGWFSSATSPSKWQTNGGNITINGTASGATGTTFGADLQGGTNGTTVTIENTGATSGGITVNGYASNGTSSNYGIRTINTNILSSSGAISLDANAVGSTFLQAGYTTTLGYLANSDVTASSANFNLTGDGLSISGALNVNGTGALTVQPYSNSFASAVSTAGLTLDSGLTGFTFGKAGNTAALTVGTAASIAGPISIYGGNITIDSGAALTSTAGNQGILLKGTGGITDSANLTTSDGDITLWANSAGATTGGIQVSNGVTLSSSGGAITLGGSANNAAISGLPAASANGNTLPQGYAENLSGTFAGVVLGTYNGTNGENSNVTINSGNGNVSIAGQSNQFASNVSFGVYTYEGINVNAGTGNITLNGLSTGAAAGSIETGINLAGFYSSASTPSKWQTNGGSITLNGTASGAAGTAYGDDLQGHTGGTTVTIENTSASSGNITINGFASNGTTSNIGIRTINTDILSAGGIIALNSEVAGTPYIQPGLTTTLGYLAGSDVTASNANIILTADAVTTSTVNVNSTGALTVQPLSNSFSSAVSTAGWTLGSGLTGLALGKSGNTANITVASAASIAGPVNIYGGNITLNAGLTASGTNTISLAGSGNVTEGASGYVSANQLALLGGNVTLTNASNAIGTLAASGVSGLTFTDSNALTIGTVGGAIGVTASGAVNIGTATGDLTLAQTVATTNATSSALILDAGTNTAAGTATGGDLVLSGSPTVSVGTGGTAKLYTGSLSGSTGLGALVGVGSGHFRYDANGNTNFATGAWANLGTGIYGIYREQPTIIGLAVNNQAMTYGNATPTWTFTLTGGQNGDTFAQAFASNPTVTVGGSISTSGNYTAGSHTLTASGSLGASDLGYAYSAGSFTTGTLAVAQRPLTAGYTGVNKIYDGGIDATVTTTDNRVTSDVLTISDTAAFVDKNVANSVAVNVSGASLSGPDGANYSLASATGSTTANITPLALTVNGSTVTSKTYDGTPTATITGGVLSGVVSADQAYVSLTQTGSFATKNAGTGIGVTSGDTIALTGTAAGNYTLIQPTGLTGTITPLALTVSGSSVASKTYDGTPAATITGGVLNGVINADQPYVSLATQGGSFATKNAGTGIAVTAADTLSLSGTALGDYILTQPTGLTANITPLALTVSGSSATSKTYDGTPAAAITGGVLNGVINADQPYVSLATQGGSFATKNAGTGIAVTAADTLSLSGTALGDYILTQPTGLTANITPKPITVDGSAGVNKTYDGTASLASRVTGYVNPTGFISGDAVSVTGVPVYSSADAGLRALLQGTVTLTGTGSSNYSLSWVNGNGTISPAPLTVAANADARFIGSTDTAGYNGVSYQGFVDGQTSGVLGGTLAISRSNAGIGAAGTYTGVLVPAGLTSTNYSITFLPGAYTIVPADELLVRATNISTTYGSAPLYAITSVQYLNGNNVVITLNPTGVSGSTYTYSDGVGGTATFTLGARGSVISGSGHLAAGNYAIGDSSFATTGSNFNGTPVVVGELTVGPLGITASAANPPSKTYDGTTSMSGTSIALSGVLSGDLVGGSGIGSFTTKDAGTGLSYSLNGLTLTGADAQDYYLINGLTAVGNNGSITPLALTVSGSSVTAKTYDGTTSATITGGVLNGVLAADQTYVSLATQGGSFASKNAGTGIAVTAADTLTVTGPAAGDYTLTEPTGLTGTINPLVLTVSGSSVTAKTYDGTTSATITGGVLNGVLAADRGDVVFTQSGTFASKNTGTGIGVTATDSLALTGTAVGDYTFTEPTGLAGTITPRSVTLNNDETAASKAYDGTTAATLSGGPLNNVVAGDIGGLSLIGTFASPNAGQRIPVTVALSGTDDGNYVLGGSSSVAANITPAQLVATANPVVTTLGGQLPRFTGTFSGFVDGQTLAGLEAAGNQAAWSSTVTNGSTTGHYAITGAFNDGNYSVVQAAGNATAFAVTSGTSSSGPSSGSEIYSLASVPTASGAAAGSQDADGTGAGPTGTNASMGNGAGLTLGANSANTASDGTVTISAAAGGSDTAVGEPGDNGTLAAKSESQSGFGGRRLIVVSGGVNSSLAR